PRAPARPRRASPGARPRRLPDARAPPIHRRRAGARRGRGGERGGAWVVRARGVEGRRLYQWLPAGFSSSAMDIAMRGCDMSPHRPSPTEPMPMSAYVVVEIEV